MEVPQALADEIKALKEQVSVTFDDKIKALDKKADERWNELKANPDAVIGESLKAILDDRAKLAEQKAETMQRALTERMDEMETKAKTRGGFGSADPDAELKAAVEAWDFNPHEFGNRGRLVLDAKAVVTITNANAGGADYVPTRPGIYTYPQDPLTMRSVILPGTITASHFKYVREKPDMEGDADYQGGATPAEGETKPKMDVYDELVTAEVATIAVLSDVSQQLFDDRPAFISFLRGRMGYRVERKLDREILNGTGNGTNGRLPGINTIATAYNNSHVGVEAPQSLDVIRYARNQVELANYVPNYVALHPTSWAGIETLKDGDERYLVGDPKTGGSTGIGRVATVWGLGVITTAGQTNDEFTVGDGTASQLFMRQELTVLASTENGTNFEKNLVTLRAELRAALAHYSVLAHVTGDLSDSVAAT